MTFSEQINRTMCRIRHKWSDADLAQFEIGEYIEVKQGMPEWWLAGGNTLLTSNDNLVPTIIPHPGVPPPVNALVVLGPGSGLCDIVLWGDGPIVVANSLLPHCHVGCGGNSTVFIGSGIGSTGSMNINVRNGGLVYFGSRGLWAWDLQVFSDDMHAIFDATTGERLNVFGGTVIVEDHVWLGYQCILLPGAHVGRDSVIGARAVVKRAIPPQSVCVGESARIVRSNVNWSIEDTPPYQV